MGSVVTVNRKDINREIKIDKERYSFFIQKLMKIN